MCEENKPVAWMRTTPEKMVGISVSVTETEKHNIPLYTHPARKLSDKVEVKESCVGPTLHICGIQVRCWLGTKFNKDAHALADEIEAKIRGCDER